MLVFLLLSVSACKCYSFLYLNIQSVHVLFIWLHDLSDHISASLQFCMQSRYHYLQESSNMWAPLISCHTFHTILFWETHMISVLLTTTLILCLKFSREWNLRFIQLKKTPGGWISSIARLGSVCQV